MKRCDNKKTIYLDMDGTIADLYGVENWLEHLETESVYPYIAAKPLIRLSDLAYRLNYLQRKGYNIGIISWLSKSGGDAYNMEVAKIKKAWLTSHMPSVKWDRIYIVPYGTPKHKFSNGNDILFDDEERNRVHWVGKAYDVHNILDDLKKM